MKRKTGLRHPEFQSSCSWTLAICLATLFFVLGANVVMLGQTGGVIYRFKGGSDGTNPYATLVADKAGNLYGTTAFGGSSPNCIYGCGTVFELTCRDRQLTETVLYTFTNESLGGRPYGGLALDQAGNIYGTTTTGGAKGYGTVFQLRRPASAGDAWNSHVLHDLTAFNNGYPIYPILDKSGTVYFEEPGGGEMGTGAVSQLSPPTLAGGAWTYTQIHSFVKSSDGFLPIGTLTFDRLGNLYGVTANGGNTTQCNSYGCGIVFELVRPSTNGGSWSEKIVYRFQPVPDANHPYSGVIFDNSGNMFGTTQQGGVNGAIYGGFGTVYELSPPKQASGSWTESLLYSFTGGSDGAGPSAAVTRDNHGNLFGTTITPTVFELSPPAENGDSWTEKNLHNFGAGWGSFAFAGLIFRSPFRAELYGATVYGGTGNNGTIYKIVP